MSTPTTEAKAADIPEAAEVAKTAEEKAAEEAQWRAQLIELEKEMDTLRAVLNNKQEKAQELRKLLGMSPWTELRQDVEHGIKTIQDSTAYQKTSQTIKVASEKTSMVLGSIGAGMTKKLSEMKNSNAFKSIEEKVGSAVSNVRSRVSSRSGSVYSFDEAMQSRGSAVPTPLDETAPSDIGANNSKP